ncbi:MAG: ATP citrate lyase citrate-binding domain-containing protein [Candidatus Dojkabacteria bacterium]|nr:ATPase [Candidatus Dojkabacteria bacterium]WKZ27648.1 MAG: ATP citrate lyase citrate-binding domain-containing protein [Candidatus Dojkabacteria bacterium]
MAQKAIQEFSAKKLIHQNISKYTDHFFQEYQGVQITPDNVDSISLPDFDNGYVAKPDELFGKRGKNNLIFMSNNKTEIIQWIKQKSSQTIKLQVSSVRTIQGKLFTFLVEPKIPHEKEFYLSISSQRDHNVIYFSNKGGVDIEENWNDTIELKIPFTIEPTPLPKLVLDKISAQLSENEKDIVLTFIDALYQLYCELDFTYLEINPFVLTDQGIQMLDCVARLDDTAYYKNSLIWGRAGITFPKPFGGEALPEELVVEQIDSKSGASLKLKVLNRNGSIWMLTSGGGGSVIFADTVGDLGFANQLANYGEYSGNPSTDETEEYADIVIKLMLNSKAKKKVLIIGGGIANFTDIKKTFIGLISAIKQNSQQIKRQGIVIFVRRGGPNYEEGLQLMKTEMQNLDIEAHVFGPETYMTHIIELAVNKL